MATNQGASLGTTTMSAWHHKFFAH